MSKNIYSFIETCYDYERHLVVNVRYKIEAQNPFWRSVKKIKIII